MCYTLAAVKTWRPLSVFIGDQSLAGDDLGNLEEPHAGRAVDLLLWKRQGASPMPPTLESF
jgi:hypothetical protein